LMKAVIDSVVALYVPAVIILIAAVAVNPNDGRMLFAALQIFRREFNEHSIRLSTSAGPSTFGLASEGMLAVEIRKADTRECAMLSRV
jgi:hypothetical protein